MAFEKFAGKQKERFPVLITIESALFDENVLIENDGITVLILVDNQPVQHGTDHR